MTGPRPFSVWVISAGLIFSGCDLLYGILPDVERPSLFDPFLVLVAAFVVFCFVAAVGTFMTQRRWGFVLSTVVSLAFAVPSLAVIPAPNDLGTYAIATSSIPILFLVTTFSLLSLLNLKKGIYLKKYLTTPKSIGGVLTAVFLIIAIASVSYGAYSTAKTSPIAGVTISMVAGASDPSNSAGHFVPAAIVVVIGVNNTVTWTNDDYTIHTVTSNSGLFGTGLLNHGDSWTHTFDAPGTYAYHCAIHPFMTGTIVVEST
jgi:plastocyanin